jgi:hypothetical protein
VPPIEKDRNYIAARNFEVVTPDGEELTNGAVSDEVRQVEDGASAHAAKTGTDEFAGVVKLVFSNKTMGTCRGRKRQNYLNEQNVT